MKLLCQFPDGTTIDLRTAIQKDPYPVRGLVCEAFFQCLECLPDSAAFLRAEQSVRDALIWFEGGEDRYIKGYVASRSLDARTKLTPRVNIIQSSFLKGGPIALVGAFHATFNASRNSRNRETLDYILAADDRSRDDLFKRSRSFPCHPSARAWFQHIVDKLELDVQFLAHLFVCLGSHPEGIPHILFDRIRGPSRTWGCDGEIVERTMELRPFLGDEVYFRSILQTLQYVGLVRSATSLRVDKQLSEWLDNNLGLWHTKAARLVCHAFPKHRSIEPKEYTELCRQFLPCLQYVLSRQSQWISPEPEFLSQAIEACLSSLDVGDLAWGTQAIVHMEYILSLFEGNNEEFGLLQARVAVGKAHIQWLSQRSPATELGLMNITYPRDDHRSIAFSAELSILKARVHIDSNDLTQAMHETYAFDATFNDTTSSLGATMVNRVELVRVDIFRIGGGFSDAFSALQPLPLTDDAISLFTAILCERGECETAIRQLKSQLHLAPDPKPEVLTLAWAHVHLFQCMLAEKAGQQDKQSSQIATDAYQALRAKVQHRAVLFSIMIGQAILLHIEGSSFGRARKAWLDTLDTLRTTSMPPGYFDALALFSLSDLALRECRTEGSIRFKNEAGAMLARYPRSHRFLGLGFLWPDILYANM